MTNKRSTGYAKHDTTLPSRIGGILCNGLTTYPKNFIMLYVGISRCSVTTRRSGTLCILVRFFQDCRRITARGSVFTVTKDHGATTALRTTVGCRWTLNFKRTMEAIFSAPKARQTIGRLWNKCGSLKKHGSCVGSIRGRTLLMHAA